MTTNGKPDVSRILSLDKQRGALRKQNDFITVAQAYDMVIQECAKVHEHYLQQIPTYVAKMTQDALLHYGLIVPLPEPETVPVAEVPPSEPAS